MNNLQKNNFLINKQFRDYPLDIVDSLQYEANSYMYHYGDHFNFKKKYIYNNLKSFISKNVLYYFIRFFFGKKINKNKKNVLSNAYFDISSYLKVTLNVIDVPWGNNINSIIIFNLKLNILTKKIQKIFGQKSLKKILDKSFYDLVYQYKIDFKNHLIKNEIKALIFSIDITFFESISISCAKELGIPTFLFLHGLPARYNHIDDNRTDYLIVWGNAIKDNYISHGVSSDKIFVSGHPIYSKIKSKTLRSSLDNILVLTKAMCGTPHSDMVRLMDRSNSLYYLDLIKDILISFGVKNARLRCHPAENPDFYEKHLKNNFFIIDLLPLDKSLEKSTLLIGPSSTMVLDAIIFGVNYILFDPLIDGKTLTGFDIVPPFDGNNFISKTNCVQSFKQNIIPTNNINWNLLNHYISSEFSLEFLYKIINKEKN
jgi:hypothetical protein